MKIEIRNALTDYTCVLVIDGTKAEIYDFIQDYDIEVPATKCVCETSPREANKEVDNF